MGVLGNNESDKYEDCKQTEDGGVYCEWGEGDTKHGEAKAVGGTVVKQTFEGYDEDEIDDKIKRIITKSTDEPQRGDTTKGVHAQRGP